MNKFVKFPLVLGIVGVICTGALSLVYEITKDTIAYNKNKVAIDLMSGIVEDISNAEPVLEQYDQEKAKKYGVTNMYRVSDSKGVAGYGYVGEVNGYNPGITFLLVLDDEESKILGFEVVSHSETNSGSYGGPLLNSPEFAAQFTNISFDDVATEIDYVAGSTAKTTMGAVLTGVDNVISFHKQEIFGEVDDGINLTGTERKKLDLPEGYTMTDKTEEFKKTLKFEVSDNVYNDIINVTAKPDVEYAKILNYIDITNGSGIVEKHAYVVEGNYNCEVEDGRAWQSHKFVLLFEADGTNTKVVIVKTTDSLGADGKDSLDSMSWVSESFDGKSMTELYEILGNDEVDKISGSTFTTNAMIVNVAFVVDAHNSAYGN